MTLKPPDTTSSPLDDRTITGQVFQAYGGLDPTSSSAIPHQGAPQAERYNVLGSYADSGSGNIFQVASYAYNSGSRSTVAVFGQGKGKAVWGGNFVGYADTTLAAAVAIGTEVDFGLIGANAGADGVATGVLIAAAGGSVGAAQNNGAYLQMQANNSLSAVKFGLKINKSGSDQPITADGSGILFNNITCAFGINFAASTFTTNAIQFGDGQNIGIGTSTGTKIGGSTSLIGLFGATPTGRYATTGTSSGFTAGAGTTVTHLSTFTGGTGSTAYTIGDVVRAMKLLGTITA